MNPESSLSRMTALYCGGLRDIKMWFPAPLVSAKVLGKETSPGRKDSILPNLEIPGANSWVWSPWFRTIHFLVLMFGFEKTIWGNFYGRASCTPTWVPTGIPEVLKDLIKLFLPNLKPGTCDLALKEVGDEKTQPDSCLSSSKWSF